VFGNLHSGCVRFLLETVFVLLLLTILNSVAKQPQGRTASLVVKHSVPASTQWNANVLPAVMFSL
jgi:hypothetical protein